VGVTPGPGILAPHRLPAAAVLLAFYVGEVFVARYSHVGMNQACRVVGMVLVVLYVVCHRRYRMKIPPEPLLYGLFFVWGAMTGPFVAQGDQEWLLLARQILQTGALIVAVTGIAVCRKSADLSFLVMIVCALIVAIYPQVTGDLDAFTGPAERARFASVIGNANGVGFVCMWGCMGLAYFWRGRRLPVRILLAVLTVPFLAGIVASASRKSFFTFLAFALLWLLFCYVRQAARKPALILFAAAATAVLAWFVSQAVDDSVLGRRLARSGDNGGDELREEMYRRGWELFVGSPIAGVGFGNYKVVSGLGLMSHSDYIEVLAGTGIVGFMIYFSLYAVLWRRLSRIQRLATDAEIRDRAGLFKAVVITELLLGLGSPVYIDLFHWLIVGGVIGCSYAMESDLARAQTGRPMVGGLRRGWATSS
jgi:O-antigen ligase